jgi:hypothetical protein
MAGELGRLTIVARLAHRSQLTANLAAKESRHPNRECRNARKPGCTPGFLAKLVTCSGQITAIDQSLSEFFTDDQRTKNRRSSESRTIVRREFDELRELVHEPGDLASGRLMRPQAQLALARSSKPPQKQLPDVLFPRSSRPLLVQFAAD